MRHVPGLILVLLLSGCATPYGKVMRSYEEAPVCCKSMKEFAFESIGIGDSISFDLDENSPAFLFETGKSFFKAFAIPQSSYPYQVSVRSYMLGDHIKSAYVFYPRVITLDDEFRVVRSADLQCFKLQKAGFAETARETWGLMYKVEGQITFAERDSAEKYLVILTTAELLRAKTSVTTFTVIPIVVPGFVSAIPGGKEDVLVPHAPWGRINISLSPLDDGGRP